jgi:putative phosphotransacetylase
MKINIGVTSRHIHLSIEDLKILFGEDYELTNIKDLTQDNNFACKETVDLINGDNIIKNVRIVGPVREKTQVEISKTDSYNLKINPPYKNSGDLDLAETIKIKGPLGVVERKCLIIQNRHIHMSESEASSLGYKNDDLVSVKLFGDRGGIIDNVHIKIGKNSTLELHIDLDDANAHNVVNLDKCEIINDGMSDNE